MSAIFIDVYSNYDSKRNYKGEFFNTPLLEQFEMINLRIEPKKRVDNFRTFFSTIFPSAFPRNYFISIPNLERKLKGNGLKYLNNVVIRAENNTEAKNMLPPKTTIILIGDIVLGDRNKSFQVKGIELIDEELKGYGEYKLSDTPCFVAYSRGSWGYDISQSIFTQSFINKICSGFYPIKDPVRFAKLYNTWQEYLIFREEHLLTQSQTSYKISNFEFLNAHMISREDYNNNFNRYEEYILDSHERFVRDEQVILRKNTNNSTEYPLVRVDFDMLNKDYELDLDKDRRNNFKNRLYAFSRENLSLSVNDSVVDQKRYDDVLRNAFSLGEKYTIVNYEIEPDYVSIEEVYFQNLREKHEEIDNKFERIIDRELNSLVEEFRVLEAEKNNQVLKERNEMLMISLFKDVQENRDADIKAEIERSTKTIKKLFKGKLNKVKKDDKSKGIIENLKKQEENELSKVSVEELYRRRNIEIIRKLSIELANKLESLAVRYLEEQRDRLSIKYKIKRQREKTISERELREIKEDAIKIKKTNETIRRISLYFKLDKETFSDIDKRDLNKKYLYLIYSNRAEKAKLDRQKHALSNIYTGYVKNPYLATYLFSPKELPELQYKNNVKQWNLTSLNDKQKEAVQKAMNSKGIFLLQGPPGTGKTQVIAEIVAQMTKEGKRVVIASETHKAIDNVFDRLPKTADIRPIRLIPSRGNKKKMSQYSPSKLLDNLYSNIAGKMKKTIIYYKNFNEMVNDFEEKKREIQLIGSNIRRSKDEALKLDKKIIQLEKKVDKINASISSNSSTIRVLDNEIHKIRRTIVSIERLDFNESDSDVDVSSVSKFEKEISCFLEKYQDVLLSDISCLQRLKRIDSETVSDEFNLLNSNSKEYQLQALKVAELKREAILLMDTDSTKFQMIRKEFQKASTILKELEKDNVTVNDLKISQIFNPSFLQKANSPVELIEIKANVLSEIDNILSEYIESLEDKYEGFKTRKKDIIDENNLLKNERKQFNVKINELNSNDLIIEQTNNINTISSRINDFIELFSLEIEYTDYEEAIEKIEKEWGNLKENSLSEQKNNEKKIPMYQKIVKYLRKERVIVADREEYTKDIFKNANLFGITCTSRNEFRENSMEELSSFGLGSIDIKNLGIDVVIIDEVSKSSLLELLIPILYGKSVILVGDHRQLPPMYDLRYLKDEELKLIGEHGYSLLKNNEFQKLYEKSFFKTLFEEIPKDYKIMLNQQYRSHSDIMSVFNHFYGGKLRIGFDDQDKRKQHYLTLIAGGRRIIEPNKHVYFVDCNTFENNNRESASTSKSNNGEAEIVKKLLFKINDEYEKLYKNGVIDKDDGENDKRMSVGVICTYSDQSKLIRNKIGKKNMKNGFRAFNKEFENRFIVSSVDDFQGDERDIIILSMVANPKNKNRKQSDFLKQFERINVAMSRARRLLIIVGNRGYLSSGGRIDLPDIDDNKKVNYNYPVYKEIIDTIETKGRIIQGDSIVRGV